MRESDSTGRSNRGGPPDLAARRRVDRLRRELGLTSVPTRVGTALRGHTGLIEERLIDALPTLAPQYDTLPNGGKRLWHAAVSNALDEFVGLVEDRPPHGPPADGVFLAIGRAEAGAGRDLLDVLTVAEASRTILSELSSQLPLTPAQAADLNDALVRYVECLYRRAEKGHQSAQATRPVRTHPPSDEEIRVRTACALIEHAWSLHPTPMYLTLSSRTPEEALDPETTPAQIQRRHRALLSITATDHIVTLAPKPGAETARTEAGEPTGHVVISGPVSQEALSTGYDTAVLQLRLIRLGIATPPSPVRCPQPDLGLPVLHPSHHNVKTAARLLLPLTNLPLTTRIALAHTLRLWLAARRPVQELAELLQVHEQTVRNHLSRLREIYRTAFSYRESLVLLVALHFVIPLWEQEAGGSRHERAADFL